MTEIVKLKKICSLIKRGITPKYTENDGIIVINQRCIRDGIILYKNARKHDIVNKKIPEDKKIIAGDVLINSTGVGTLGRVSQIYPISEMTVDSHVTIVRANPSDVDLAYFGYYLKLLQPSFEASGEGSTGQTELARERIGEHEIILPLKSEQVKIGKLLSNIDDLIQNNKIMNETFEEMARVIFKSWFVDFDPVHAKVAGNAPTNMKAEIAALFPNSFSDDGLPLGWVNNELSNVCSLLGGYAFKSQEFVNEGMPVVKIKNITGNGDVSLKDCQFIDSKSTNGKDKFKLEDGDLLIAMTGATVGKTGIITDGKMTPYLNQRVGKFVPKHSFYKWAIWAYLQFKKNVDAVVATGTGSAQTNISSPGIISVKWTEAPHEIYKVFDEIVSPYFNLWISNRHQNQTLTELRDTLLPKLMSGEIRVKDAENKVEAAV